MSREIEAIFQQGVKQLEAEEYSEALATFNHILDLQPNHHRTLKKRGETLGYLDRCEEALENLNRAVELEVMTMQFG